MCAYTRAILRDFCGIFGDILFVVKRDPDIYFSRKNFVAVFKLSIRLYLTKKNCFLTKNVDRYEGTRIHTKINIIRVETNSMIISYRFV